MITRTLATVATVAATAALTVGTATADTGFIDVNRHGVVQAAHYPTCTVEDASSGPVPCMWNLGDKQTGNGIGLSYYVTARTQSAPRHFHYVWPHRPTHRLNNGWRWVGQPLADALAEGGSDGAGSRKWEQCLVNVGPTTRVLCADGHREVS